MKTTRRTLFPLIILSAVLIGTVLLALFPNRLAEEIELKIYDLRMRMAAHAGFPSTTNLAFVCISDETIQRVNGGDFGFRYGLYWPRHVYGRALRELQAQGVNAVGMDVFFGERRTDHAPTTVKTNAPGLLNFLSRIHPDTPPILVNGRVLIESDEFLAWQLNQASNVILAVASNIRPFPLLQSNTCFMGDISAEPDSDGVLRRVQAFRRQWHPTIMQAADECHADLDEARIDPRQIVVPSRSGPDLRMPLDERGTVDLAAVAGTNLPPDEPHHVKPFSESMIWNMGIVMAAREIGADLSRAEIDLGQGWIHLHGTGGIERHIPVDACGRLLVNWRIPVNSPRLTQMPFDFLLEQDADRNRGWTNDLENVLAGKLVVVGSSATGNDLTDRGATPIEKSTLLASTYWNVANSIITGDFIRPLPQAAHLGIIVGLGVLTALFSMKFQPLTAICAISALAIVFCAMAFLLFLKCGFWIPMALPILGMASIHGCLTTHRVVVEQKERQRIRSVFSRVVSPEVVRELLESEDLNLGGCQSEVTVLFSDVRGFTTLADESHARVRELANRDNMSEIESAAMFDEQARNVLRTINDYLGMAAEIVGKHKGTLDKYIGDCVMAFWGAPISDPKHALHCVNAAIDIQRAIHRLNESRAAENLRRREENTRRSQANQLPLPLLPLLKLGTGINTGIVTVGLMGAEASHQNYTVFGREVNLASRLESLSDQSRIFIGEGTYRALKRDAPDLAAQCRAHAPVAVKGFREMVQVYEVPWTNLITTDATNS
jgi:class 3 adenylate cyclase/CHASE2 domain-containing sensor protein